MPYDTDQAKVDKAWEQVAAIHRCAAADYKDERLHVAHEEWLSAKKRRDHSNHHFQCRAIQI